LGKRNAGRFPADSVFQLSRAERDEVAANCDHLQRFRFSPTMPFAVAHDRFKNFWWCD
jgi:hypothetical protein